MSLIILFNGAQYLIAALPEGTRIDEVVEKHPDCMFLDYVIYLVPRSPHANHADTGLPVAPSSGSWGTRADEASAHPRPL